MKKQNGYKLEIQNPCQESWQSMKETEGGRFCFNCEKNVIDFTQLSDKEIIKMIENREGKICGRLSKTELDRVLISEDEYARNAPFYKIAAGLLAFGLLPATHFAQQRLPETLNVHTLDTNARQTLTIPTEAPKDSSQNIIRGVIKTWDTEDPLIGATIHIKGANIGTMADVDGRFELKIPEELLKDDIIIYVNYTGFETSEIILTKEKLPMEAHVYLNESYALLGEVVIVGQVDRTLFSFKKNKKKKFKP